MRSPLPIVIARFILPALCLCAAMASAAPTSESDPRAIERLFRGGDTALAMTRVDQAIKARPDDATLRFTKGVMLTELRRSDEAIDVFERLTEEFPDLPEPYNNLAVLLAAQGRIDRARELLETALRHDPGYLTAHENLGDVFARLALRAYEAASGGRRVEPALERKLRLARDLSAPPR